MKITMEMRKRIHKVMNENGIMGDIVDYGENFVCIEVTWGDWKHAHMRLAYAMEQEFQEIIEHESQITESDDSDCYSAIHTFRFSDPVEESQQMDFEIKEFTFIEV